MRPTLSDGWLFLFLVAFRQLDLNDLTELPPGIFDSLALLTVLYVVSLVAETSFVPSLPPSLVQLDFLGLVSSFVLAQQDIAR